MNESMQATAAKPSVQAPLPSSLKPSSRRRAAKEKTQLSLALPLPRQAVRRSAKPCPRERAAWWFAQMRRVVEEEIVYETSGLL